MQLCISILYESNATYSTIHVLAKRTICIRESIEISVGPIIQLTHKTTCIPTF